MNRYPDEYLDHWADRYIERNIGAYGVTLETFLAHPHEIDRALSGCDDLLPLLTKQRAASTRQLEIERAEARLEREASRLTTRNGALFEPLHHHAHPDNKQSNFNAGRLRHAD